MYYCCGTQGEGKDKVYHCYDLRDIGEVYDFDLITMTRKAMLNQIVNFSCREENGQHKIVQVKNQFNLARLAERKKNQESLKKYQARLEMLGLQDLVEFMVCRDGRIQLLHVDPGYPNKTFTVPEFVTYIAKGEFRECDFQKIIIRNSKSQKMSLSEAFMDLYSTELELVVVNQRNVISMEAQFSRCLRLKKLVLKDFDWQNVWTIKEMCYGCECLTDIDFGKIETMRVQNMFCQFNVCRSLENVDFLYKMNLQQVKNCANAFFGCSSLVKLDLSRLNLQSLEEASGMFSNCRNLQYVQSGKLNAPNLVQVASMFRNTSIQYFNMAWFNSKLERIDQMFGFCHKLETVDFNGADLSRVTELNGLFEGSWIKRVSFAGCKFGRIISIKWLFRDCQELTSVEFPQNIDSFDFIELADEAFQNTAIEILDLSFIHSLRNLKQAKRMFLKSIQLRELIFPRQIPEQKVNDTSMFITLSQTTINLRGMSHTEFQEHFKDQSYLLDGRCDSLTPDELDESMKFIFNDGIFYCRDCGLHILEANEEEKESWKTELAEL